MNGCTDNMPKKQSSSQGSFFFLVLLAVWTGVFLCQRGFF